MSGRAYDLLFIITTLSFRRQILLYSILDPKKENEYADDDVAMCV